MSLTSALNTAQSLLSNTSTQTSIVSKNIANAGNAHYARRSADLTSNAWGAEIVRISRATDEVLFRATLGDGAAASGQGALLEGIDQIRALLGGNEYDSSPSALLGSFQDAMQIFAGKPSDAAAAQSAVAEAKTLADGIRETSIALQGVRADTDAEIGRQVDRLNELLVDFKKANDDVKQATATGSDGSNALDERNRLLGEITAIVGVTPVTRANNDVALFTANGTALFETVPREVSFTTSGAFDATTSGNAVLIDGVPLAAGSGGASNAKGSLAGLLQIRDEVAPAFQSQLDEVARGLITAFAETGPDGTQPAMAGLFTSADGTVPAGGTLVPGLAASLTINDAFTGSADAARLLRDGGANGDDYIVNIGGGASYSALLDGYLGKLDAPMAFDTAAGLGSSSGLMEFAASSAGWLEDLRQQASTSAETKTAAHYRSSQALSNSTGVSLDEEMMRLIELEQSYKASSKLIATVDEMINQLLAAFR